jgi:hypothetical protein
MAFGLLLSLIVRNDARGLFRGRVPGPITRRRCQSVNLVLIGPELDTVLVGAAGDHDLTIGRIAGSGNLEGTWKKARQCIRCRHRGNLNELVIGRPNGTARRRHAGDDGWCLVDPNGEDLRSLLVPRIICRKVAQDGSSFG